MNNRIDNYNNDDNNINIKQVIEFDIIIIRIIS